jgi:hypothetical protein
MGGMEALSTIISQLGLPLSVAGLFGGTLTFFMTFEKMFAPEALADFARYLKSTELAETVVRLPDGTRALFQRVFGARHFSWRCVKTSMVFSVVSFAVIVGLTVLYDPVWRISVARTALEMPALFNLSIAWVIWSIVPDYFNLLKTRTALDLITSHQITRPSVLIGMLFADFLIGWVIFVLTFLPITLLNVHLVFYVLGIGGVTWQHVVDNFVFSPLPLSSIFHWIFGVLFWPGMVPSIWLWFFIVATLIVRASARTAPVLRLSMYWFDGERHPIRFVGMVAAALVSVLYGAFLLMSEFEEALSE